MCQTFYINASPWKLFITCPTSPYLLRLLTARCCTAGLPLLCSLWLLPLAQLLPIPSSVSAPCFLSPSVHLPKHTSSTLHTTLPSQVGPFPDFLLKFTTHHPIICVVLSMDSPFLTFSFHH